MLYADSEFRVVVVTAREVAFDDEICHQTSTRMIDSRHPVWRVRARRVCVVFVCDLLVRFDLYSWRLDGPRGSHANPGARAPCFMIALQ